MVISLLDFIFPKKCVLCGEFGEYFCKDCYSRIEYVDAPVCPVCQRQAIGGKTHPGCARRYSLDGLVIGCRYRDAVKKAIAKVKYRWVYDIEKVLVDLLVSQIWKFDLPGDLVLVPVPLHKKRKNWRGFNQAEILAEDLSKKFGVEYSDTMIRIIETKTQVGLKKDERKKNVKGAFRLKDGAWVKGKNILLVDDVYTSGATMAECARVLKRAGAKCVWGIAIALG